MEIVGKSEFTEEQIQAGQQDPFAEDQIGQYDLHLVTEPEGADPEWAEGTDKYMASLEHNVPPPVPTASTSRATPSPSKKVSKKVSQRQEAIDYLFPFQAEARKAAQESESSSSDKVDKSLGAQIQRLLNMEGYEVSLDGSGPSRGHGFDGALTGQRFLVNQLMKHKWSGMWEWEPTRQALIAASKKASSGTFTKSSTDAKGKGKATAADKEGNLNMQKSLDQLRKASKAGARATAKAGKQAAAAAAKLRAAAPNDVQTLWVSMPMDGSAPRIVEMPNQKKNNNKRDAKEEEEEENEIDAALETAKREPLFAEEEIRQVLEQAEKFQGFFNKSIDVELQKKGPKASAAAEGETNIFTEVNKRLSTKNENAVIDEAYLDEAMGEWVSEQEFDSNGDIILEGDMHDSRFVNDLPSDESIDARWRASGSRLSALQAYRGRSLRATLQERLSLKGVDLVGTYKWIEMDSVKRKRRKRISKHKWVHFDVL